MRWSLSAVLFFSVICAVRPDDSTEPSLHIMARSSVFDVGETRAIFCKGINVLEPVEWYSPSGKLVEERSSSNNRIYVERPVNDNGILRPLILTNIKISDTGNWTCRAGNISETKEFIVGEKVKIPDKNVTIEGQEGESIRFTCEAKGHPSPVVTWYKDKTPINDKDKSGKYLIRSDNSLEINQLNHVDVGMYFCKVTQRALSHFTEKAIYFTVQHVPVLYNMEKQSYYETPTNTYKTEEVYAILNETKNISCGAIANPAAQYTWRRRFNSVDSDPITANDTVITSEDGSSSVLVLRLYNESYIGEYKCTAKNTKGNVSIVFDVTLGTKPEPPDYVSLIYSNTSMLAFNVTCSYCNLYSGDRYSEDPKNLTVLGYNFQFVPVREGYDDPDWDDAVEFPVDIFMVNDTSFAVGPLANSTKYFGRVRSRNAAGYSEWLNITPNPETTSYVARLAATFVLSTSLWLFTRII